MKTPLDAVAQNLLLVCIMGVSGQRVKGISFSAGYNRTVPPFTPPAQTEG